MIWNITSFFRALYVLFLDKDSQNTYQKIEFSRKHYPRDCEELKKLNIESI
jgi:hypothetical protein